MDFLKSHPLAPYTESCLSQSSSISCLDRLCILFCPSIPPAWFPPHEFLHVPVTKLEKVIASRTFCKSHHRRLLYWGIIPRGLSPTTISDCGLKGCKCFAETVLHSGIPLFLKVFYCHQGRRFTSTDRHPSEQRKRYWVTSNFHERLWTHSYCQRTHLDGMKNNY